ncbi:MAG: hypothetical protein AB1706_17090 [Pseudomonadota bacterium]
MKKLLQLFIAFTFLLCSLPAFAGGGYIPGSSTDTDITGKADKLPTGVAGNFMTLDASGNIADSGKKPADYLESETDPVFTASDVFSVTSTDISNWNAKLDAETDPVFTADSSVTKQGNTFNGASQLVQLNGSSQLPAVSGALLTNLPASVDGVNIEVLTGSKTLTNSDVRYQFLSSNGTSREVNLPTVGVTTGKPFTIKNIVADTVGFNDYLYIGGTDSYVYAGQTASVVWNGSAWKALDAVGDSANKYNAMYGNRSIGTNSGAGFGYDAYAGTFGSAIGRSAKAYDYSFAGGAYVKADASSGTSLYNNILGGGTAADATSAQSTLAATVAAGKTHNNGIGNDIYFNSEYSFAAGKSAKTNEDYQKAFGARSTPQRYGEFRYLNYGVSGTTPFRNDVSASSYIYFKDTSNATPAITYLDNSAKRLTVVANSVMTFKALVAARDYTSGDGAAYELTGAIKRDGSNNTAIVGSVTKTVIAKDDASWDIDATADDTNEALQFTVTGDSTNAVRWAIRVDVVETTF